MKVFYVFYRFLNIREAPTRVRTPCLGRYVLEQEWFGEGFDMS